MFSWDNPDDRVAVVQMNAELRHARLEMLSAECATHQLRLRFSIEDLARYAEQDLLRKAIDSASALNEFYASIERQIPAAGQIPNAGEPKVNEEQILEVSASVASYLREQRDRYFPSGTPLSEQRKAVMQAFFSLTLLSRIRVVELAGARIPNPPFYSRARGLGFSDLPDFPHMPSLTFQDVIVFNDKITDSDLFHGLVHAAQFQILGVQRYSDLLVRGFLRTNAHFAVPLEAHAFALESKFARNGIESFSVEEQVRLWIREGRY
jgi:hypothetical protein